MNRKKSIILFITMLVIMTMTGCALPIPGVSPRSKIILPDEEGYADGRAGDVMRSYFFDFTVNNAYLCDVYGSYLPAPGNDLLVIDLTIKNTFNRSLPMFDSDFMVTWGEEEDYDVPVTYYGGITFDEEVFPSEYTLKVNESRDGIMIFEVPEGNGDFSIFYLEVFDDDSTGDVFFVYFSAEKQ